MRQVRAPPTATTLNLRTTIRLGLRVLQQRAHLRRPLFATFSVTDRCNVRCDGCVYYANLDDHVVRERERTDRALTLLRGLAEGGVPVVSFAGGEPFLRKDLGLLMRASARMGMGVTVVTNAMVPNEDATRAAEEVCDAVVFSPHPPSELNGKNPTERWERAWQGFAELRRALRRPTLTCGVTLGKHTVPVLEEILERAIAAGADRIRCHPNFFPEQFPDRASVERAAALLRRWTARYPKRFDDPGVFLDDLPSFFGERPRVPCTADRRLSLGLLLDGTVSACCAAHVPIGNLFERPLATMLTERIEDHPDCFGCNRYEVVRALALLGEPI